MGSLRDREVAYENRIIANLGTEGLSVIRLLANQPVFSYKLRYIVGFWLVEMTISTNQKPTLYRNLYENPHPDHC